MRCVSCGHEIVEGAAFCAYCGAKVVGERPENDKPIYETDVKWMLKSGKLSVYRDRTEFSTSRVQKSVFNYSALVAVKKRLVPNPAILFITENGQTEACPATVKNIHEAFLYIEQASRPYIEERKEQLLSQGIRYSFVSSSGLTGGILNIMDDKAEFTPKSGQSETVDFQDVKSVSISKGLGTESLEFSLYDGRVKAYGVDRQSRDEILSFVKKSIEPFITRRKKALLDRGIYFSFLSGWSQAGGTLDIYEDRAEFTDGEGRTEAVSFQDVRQVSLLSETMELALTDGTFRSFSVDRDEQDQVQVQAFIENAIRPYVMKRTLGFDTSFGVDERIEINEQRGVFHIIRQGGNAISEEISIEDITRCRQVESTELNRVISGVLSGGKTILSSAAGVVGMQTVPDTEEKISLAGVELTIRTEEGEQEETIRFGSFPLGISRTAPKYSRYREELSRLMDYLGSNCPECELIVPVPLAIETGTEEIVPEIREEEKEPEALLLTATEIAVSQKEEDVFGIKKYMERASRYIEKCQTPMTIAVQESWGSGGKSILETLFDQLEEGGRDTLIRFRTRQFSKPDLGERLPMVVGAELINQMGGMGDSRVTKFAKGLINLTTSILSQGGTDGQYLIEAFFKDNAVNSLDDFVRTFSEMVKKKVGDSKSRVIVFVNDMDRLAPAKQVELLEAMEYFFDCKGCVFAMAVDYNTVIGGVRERYGGAFAQENGEKFFNKIFRVSLRLPVSDFRMENYVKNKLEHMEIYPDSEEEIRLYGELIQRSVGREPESIDHLFDSFLLLKTLADEEMYENRTMRLLFFAVLCMKAGFRDFYVFLAQMKNKITPDFLSELCSGSDALADKAQPGHEEKERFRNFARIFYDIFDTDQDKALSEEACGMLAEVLNFS